jgi:hypothetical protein
MTNTPPPYPGPDPEQQPHGQAAPHPYGPPVGQPVGQASGQPAAAGMPYAPPPKQSRTKRILISLISIVVAVVVAFLVRQAITAWSGGSTEDKVSKAVAQIREQSDLPKQVDSVTTWTGIEAEGSAIHYDYTVSKTVDPSSVTTAAVRNAVGPTLCSTKETKELLDDDVDMRYTYAFDGSAKTLDVTFTKADCS